METIDIDGVLVPCYSTREECEKRVDELSSGAYYLSPWEASSPFFSAQYAIRDGKRWWYVYAEFNFRPDSDAFQEDGPYESPER